MSLGKGLCHVQSHRMVVQTMPMRIGGKDDIQKLENFLVGGRLPIRSIARYFHSFISPTHQGLFLQGQKGACCICLCILSAKHSAWHEATTQKYLPKRAHRTHQWWLQWCSNLETVSSLVRRSLQTNNHDIILNIFLNIFQPCFLKQSALEDGLIFACIFSPMPRYIGPEPISDL